MFLDFLCTNYPDLFEILKGQSNKFAMRWIYSDRKRFASLIDNWETSDHICPGCYQVLERDCDNDLVCPDCLFVFKVYQF